MLTYLEAMVSAVRGRYQRLRDEPEAGFSSLEWAILAEALPPPGAIDPLTATPEEIKAYLVLHPRLGRLPPR